MELKEITKRCIEETTGVPFSDLLEKKPEREAWLSKLQKPISSANVDPLVRGNPQLTLGYVATVASVDAYFDEKTKERGDEGERHNRRAP